MSPDVRSHSPAMITREWGQEHRINALILIISAPAVLRCALVLDVIVYAVTQLAMLYCRTATKPPAWLVKGAQMLELAIGAEVETCLDSLNAKLASPIGRHVPNLSSLAQCFKRRWPLSTTKCMSLSYWQLSALGDAACSRLADPTPARSLPHTPCYDNHIL